MVRPISLSKEEAAAAAWTLISEPGDEAAGLLRLTFGAEKSLGFLTSGANATRIATELADSDSAQLATQRFVDVEKTMSESLERWKPRLQRVEYESALKLASVTKTNFLAIGSEYWPAGLSDLGLAMPAGLWVRGSLSQLNDAIAIVGSRAATSYGEWVCAELVSVFKNESIPLVSGGAFGIDAAAHRFANRLELPNFAVMAGGVDRFYPLSNRDLLTEVIRNGAVLSELPPGKAPTRWRFLQRNRLIAALSRAVVVVEAGHRSGAINTANHAATIGRPVAAIPGSIQNATSLGCHRLIREGVATLVSNGQELLEVAGIKHLAENEIAGLGILELRVIDAMTSKYQTLEQIALRAGLTSVELATALGGLQLAGLAERDSSNSWRKRLNL